MKLINASELVGMSLGARIPTACGASGVIRGESGHGGTSRYELIGGSGMSGETGREMPVRDSSGEELVVVGDGPIGDDLSIDLVDDGGVDDGLGTPPAALPQFDVLGSFAAADDEEPDWQERALCAQTDPEAFFPEKGGSTREAKRICSGCEVRAECLDYALAHDERFGIWGGLSERERRRLRRAAI